MNIKAGSIINNIDIDIKNDTNNELYDEYKDNMVLDLSFDLFEYCRIYNPSLMEYGNISDLSDILFEYIELDDPFIVKDESSESDEDEFEEY